MTTPLLTVHISGASDDLIEVDGDVQLEGDGLGGPAVVTVNGVDLLEVTYDLDGLWRITVLGEIPDVSVEVFPTPGEDVPRDPPAPKGVASYSDYAVVRGPLTAITIPGDTWSPS